ncbi:MAG: ribulose-phosphate 3-epimerase [Bdellovibrionales bacterium]|jgi:ribulose-phosphate 3-epimerase|nr:ribulose-phosphate 3-epimerase [Bdellovibrionales bacterium]
MIIAPSLLSCDFLNIESELKHFDGMDDLWLHLDIMDGHFVPNLTFGPPIVKMISEKTNLPLDAHCMVTNPRWHMEAYSKMGVHNFTFHLEACDDALELIKDAKKYYKSVGISIKPNTPVSDISDEILASIDLLLVMSVEPGFGGQSFIEGTYDKLDQIQNLKNENGYNFHVQVDGGVGEGNYQKLSDHGATNLVAGSFVFKKGPDHYHNQIKILKGE